MLVLLMLLAGLPATKKQVKAWKALPREERERLVYSLPVPSYEVRRLTGHIVVDGRGEEEAWEPAGVIELNRDMLGRETDVRGTIRILWDDSALYFLFDCADADIRARHSRHDDSIWQDDVAEIFLDPDSDGLSYMEFETSPRNVRFDALFADFRPGTDWFARPNWSFIDTADAVRAFHAPGVLTAVEVPGTVNDSSDTDEGYCVEWRIPFAALREPEKRVQRRRHQRTSRMRLNAVEPPRPGDEWRASFLLHDVGPEGGKYASWSALFTGAHIPKRFGRLVFRGQ